MATRTLTRPDVFPDGTVVGAYLPPRSPGGSLGAKADEQTVAGDAVTFTGLALGTQYVAVGGNGRQIGFTTDSGAITATVVLTQAEYDALAAPDAGTLYVIVG